MRWRVKGILPHQQRDAQFTEARFRFADPLAREAREQQLQASVQNSGDFSLKAVAFGQNIEVPRRKLSAIWR
ncbi:MAG: hypothetical protein R3B96_06225 [Pirellulaceae bacterium]